MNRNLLTLFLCLIGMGFAVAQSGDPVVKLEENFDAFTEGSIEEPASVDIASYSSGKLSQVLVGWKGSQVYEAGGSLLVGSPDVTATGQRYLETPTLGASASQGNIKVTARIKSLESYGNVVEFYSGSYTKLTDFILADGEWHEVAFVTDRSITLGLRVKSLFSASFFIDYLKVEQSASFVLAPTSYRPADFDGTTFTARWSAVKGAEKYLVSVYTKKANGSVDTELPVQESTATSLKITVPDAASTWYFTVKAVVNGNESLPSDEQHVVKYVEKLDAPVATDATNITATGFTANWNGVENAEGYSLDVYKTALLEADATVTVISEDFSGITQGEFPSTKFPDGIIKEYLDSYTKIPGWFAYNHAYSSGYLVLYPLGTEAFLDTPVLDFSKGGGALTVKLRLAACDYASFVKDETVTVGLFVGDEELENHAITIDTEDFKDYALSFTKGAANAYIKIAYSGSNKVFIDNVDITQLYKAGETLKSLITTLDVKGLSQAVEQAMNPDITYSYTVKAYVNTVNTDGADVVLSSAASNEVEIKGEAREPGIVLTFASLDNSVRIGTGGAAGTTFSVDWGDGELDEYSGATYAEGKPKSTTVKIYGEDLQILQAVQQGITAVDVTNAPRLTRIQLGYNELKSIDVTNNTALRGLYCEANQIESLDVKNNTALTVIDCHENQIEGELDCSALTDLTKLTCYTNKIASLKLPATAALTGIECGDNLLETLDVSGLPNLEELDCYGNKLSAIDLSANTALTKIYCPENRLTSLDVSKLTKLETLTAFENELTAVDISQNTALTGLYLQDNQLVTLTIGAVNTLSWVNLSNNRLDAIDLTAQTRLSSLYVNGNQLTSIDITNSPYVYTLFVDHNNLSSLDVSNQQSLSWLSCGYNQLSTLDLSNNGYLSWLECENNGIAKLDVSQQTNLQKLIAGNNKFASLDLTNNKGVQGVIINNNAMAAAEINSLIAALPDVSAVEIHENNEARAKQLNISYMPGTSAADKAAAEAKGWIVTAEPLAGVDDVAFAQAEWSYDASSAELVATAPVGHAAVYAADGKLMLEVSDAVRISVADLMPGVYIVKGIDLGGRKTVLKFRKNR